MAHRKRTGLYSLAAALFATSAGCSLHGSMGGSSGDASAVGGAGGSRAETATTSTGATGSDAGGDGGGGGTGDARPEAFFDAGLGMGISAYHACIITPEHDLQCFGKHQARTTPPDGLKADQISAGHLHNCVITPPRSEEPVVCFGFGEAALAAPDGLVPSQVSVGEHVSCVVGDGGAVSCWWDDELAALPPEGLVAKYVATSAAFTCAIDTQDRVRCWGLNPPELPEDDLQAAHISVAQSEGTTDPPETRMRHACAVRLDHSVVCWGDDTEGEVSNVPEGLLATQVSIGNTEACAVSTAGDLVCWGKAPANLEGLERPAELRARAVRIVHNNGCALVEDEDRLRCWGFNDPERYAEGTPDDVTVFVPSP